jgi:hypothetical protein
MISQEIQDKIDYEIRKIKKEIFEIFVFQVILLTIALVLWEILF